MYGWRARIGLLVVGSDVTCESEMHKFAPPGVAFVTSRMKFLGKVTPETVERLAEDVERATELLIPAKVNVIAFCCTSGSFIKGAGWDKEIIDNIESKYAGISATTTSTAVVAALRCLKIKNVAVATPYVDDVNKHLKKFLTDEGFNVINIKGLGILEDAEVNNLPPEIAYKLAKEVDTTNAEGIFISCTSLRTLNVIDLIERDLSKPVVTSNQATLWHSLRKAKINDIINGCGELLTQLKADR
jgi:maleate isomerase